MSDSDSSEYEPLFPTTKPAVKANRIILDPAKTLSERQKETELEAKIAELEGGANPSEEIKKFESLINHSYQQPVEEIKYIHPGHTTFIANESYCVFTEECVKIKNFKPTQGEHSKSVFELGDSHVQEIIRLDQLKCFQKNKQVSHCLCLYLFFLASVHHNDRIVDNCANTIQYIRKDWFPSVASIFTVFINWGIRSDLLNVEDVEPEESIPFEITRKFPGQPRKWNYNFERILDVISCTAQDIARETEDSKLNKLISILVHSALEPNARLWAYSRCITSLLNHIPEEHWNNDRVQTLVQLLFKNVSKDYHNLCVVCCTLLTRDSRAKIISRSLTCFTLNHLLANEKTKEPLDAESCHDIFKVLNYYGSLHDLNFYRLYIALRLLDHCVQLDYNEDRLSLEQMQSLAIWLSTLDGNILTSFESLDCSNVKEMITRCLSCWKIMLSDMSVESLCNITSLLTEDLMNIEDELEDGESGKVEKWEQMFD